MFKFLKSPYREPAISILAVAALVLNYFYADYEVLLWTAGIVGALPVFWEALKSIRKFKISIDTFNGFVLVVSFLTGQLRSAAFIVLMLAFASVLEWRTSQRSRRAIEELLRLKPVRALRARPDGGTEEIKVDAIQAGDILVLEPGDRVPADGVVIYGRSLVNEAPVTGESVPVEKGAGSEIISGTLNTSGVLKFKVLKAGADSTLERMAALIKEASEHKSRSEKLADRFAGIFMPVVILLGAGTYLVTHSLVMTAALFMVACADDMAVAIPLAVTASMGRAATRGIVIKGGEWLDVMGRVKTVVLDKTGTLTHGDFAFREAKFEPGIDEKKIWKLIGATERFSGHPVGRAILKAAEEKAGKIPEPDTAESFHGIGIKGKLGADTVAIGNEKIGEVTGAPDPRIREAIGKLGGEYGGTTTAVLLNGKFAGVISVADVPRPEARQSIERLRMMGISKILMFTGDREEVAEKISRALDLDGYRAAMKPEEKLTELRKLSAEAGPVAMVGDGINDGPALAAADVGLAMGQGGTAVAVEAADIVILTDKLDRIPELVELGRRTTSVVNWDVGIWIISNLAGFALVFMSILGPALAAFYNFMTDFLPLLNSTRLFRKKHGNSQG